jgi:hypothetical protein
VSSRGIQSVRAVFHGEELVKPTRDGGEGCAPASMFGVSVFKEIGNLHLILVIVSYLRD